MELHKYISLRVEALDRENKTSTTLERLQQVKGALDELSKLLNFLNAQAYHGELVEAK